ncbi:CYFA0S04e05952g1_1 [Cyberlindnera fabianii]|uniref:Allantoate permease n=1 Tax=Cyberlindnera fabianii TaxID=36022 RepID=A0A061ARL3_CYBFA|nr:Allantoate permease [Cyberlindnera fabianii]CDR40209.1 CYFA0S04e05952g1_1 [Cyberlindnera fabianii]
MSVQGSKIESKVSTEDADIASTEVLETVISLNGREFKLDQKNVDEAMNLAMEAQNINLTPEQDRKLRWKIDTYLIPFFVLMYAVQYMDKITNSFASVMGIKTDLHMAGWQYSWLGSAFYLGYLAFELPASYILQRFPVAKATSCFILLWGVVVCLMPATNLAGFMFLRVVLGMLESSITPTMVILTTQWYKKEEHFLRTAIWLGACHIGAIIGYAFAYGLYIHGGKWDIPSWKVVYIVIGLCNLLLAAAFYFHIPDTPAGAWFLTAEEKLMAVERIRNNQQGYGNKKFKKEQLIECLTDWRIWLMFAFGIVDEIPNGGITNFTSILLNTDFKYSTKESLLLNIPLSCVGFSTTVIIGCLYSFNVIKSRIWCSILALSISLAGSCMLAFASTKRVGLGGLFIMQVSDIGFICLVSIFQSNVAGHTKKVVGNAIFLIAYCTGNVIGPQTFKQSEEPNYPTAKGTIVGCYSACIVILLILFWSYSSENRARDQKREELGEKYVKIENIEFADLTDRQNPDFRYSL